MKKVQNGTRTLQEGLASPEIQAKVVRPLISVKEIKEVAETAPREELDKAVAEARKYITDISGFMSRSVTRIRAIQAAPAEERMVRYAELEGLIDSVLAHIDINGNATPEEKLLNEAARQAYALALVSTLPADRQARIDAIKGGAKSRLPGLIRVGILEPIGGDGRGNAAIVKEADASYKINGGRQFAIKIMELLTKNSEETAKTARENFRNLRELAEKLKTQATISVAELLTRKSGKFSMNIADTKNGDKFLPGGVLLGESDGKAVRIIRAVGHFQRILTEAAEAGVFIPVESLGCDRLELAKRLPDDKFRLARILHAVLRRGIAGTPQMAPREERPAATVPTPQMAPLLH